LEEEQLKKKLATLLKEKRNIERRIAELQNQFVQQLCPKEKRECEPAYCMYRMTDTCPFLKKWREILAEDR